MGYSRLSLFSVLCIVLFGGTSCRFPQAEEASRDAPVGTRALDVLLVTVDTLRADALGFSGNARAHTPTLDRLAGAGRFFTNAHAHSVLTLPSHANIMTGLLPYEHGIRENSGFVLAENFPTLAGVLQREGFATAAFVAAFPLDARFGLHRGFDLYDDQLSEGSAANQIALPERSGGEVVERALDWWNAHQGKRRFAWVHLFEPHSPYHPPEPFSKTFASTPYLGEVAATDAFLKPLLEPFLEGGRPSALIVVTSDHGESLGGHGELTHGIYAYEATLRVPLIIWGAGIRGGGSDEAARHIDILPTILDATGVAPPPGVAGRSLLDTASPDESVSTYFESMGGNLKRGWAPLRGIIRDDMKFIDLPLPELYELDGDPNEVDNLFDDRPRLVAELLAELPLEQDLSPGAVEIDPEVARRLRSLGYATGHATLKKHYGPQDDPKNLIHLDRKLHRFSALYGNRRLAEAAQLMREVIAERPSMPEPHSYLAQALLEAGQLEEAVAVLEKARQQGFADDTILHQLALTQTWLNRPEKAIALLQPIVDSSPKPRVETLNALGTALAEAGRPEEAIAVLERIFSVDPSNSRAYENLAAAALAAGRPKDARRYAEQALALDDHLSNSWNNLGVALVELGQIEAALDSWQRAVELDPTAFDTLFNLGIVSIANGRKDQGVSALLRFVELAPEERFREDIVRARAILERER